MVEEIGQYAPNLIMFINCQSTCPVDNIASDGMPNQLTLIVPRSKIEGVNMMTATSNSIIVSSF